MLWTRDGALPLVHARVSSNEPAHGHDAGDVHALDMQATLARRPRTASPRTVDRAVGAQRSRGTAPRGGHAEYAPSDASGKATRPAWVGLDGYAGATHGMVGPQLKRVRQLLP